MRRVMLSALLALALPSAALPTGVFTHLAAVPCFDFRSGTFGRDRVHASFTAMLEISVVGSDNTISLDTGTLAMVPPECALGNPEVICFRFSNGTVTLKKPAGDTVFTDSLKGGFISTLDGRVNLDAVLVPNATVLIGKAHFAFEFNHHTIDCWGPPVFGFNVSPILEPGRGWGDASSSGG